MASLKEIRVRIASVKSTKQITSAMKMVSAAKLRKAQDHIIQLRPYAEKLTEILSHLAASINPDDNKYATVRDQEKVILVMFTSNRGLCGGFNSNIVKRVIADLTGKYRRLYEAEKVDILAIGKKGADLLKSKGFRITELETEIFDNLSYENVLPIVEGLMRKFLNETYDIVDVYFNQFVNAATQIVQQEQFLPIATPSEEDDNYSVNADYIFEPTKSAIIDELIPKSLKIQFYRYILDSNASEHGARMTSMHKATDNATELIKDLTLDYNKARQASITNEILEIVGGAEALKG
jgi:F-type H+-transporting ATPase subunit gamma